MTAAVAGYRREGMRAQAAACNLLPEAGMAGQDRAINEGARMSLEDVIFVIGEPRSGTTWVGKIMDSHPDVIYRHEPDFAIYDDELPFIVPEAETPRYTERGRRFFGKLLTEPTLKSAGPPPFFPKSYHAPGIGALRTGIVTILTGLRSVSNWRNLNRLYVPDIAPIYTRQELRFVLKSVGAAGRTGVLKQAFPSGKFIFVLRHPCGQVRSVLEGRRSGRAEPHDAVQSASLLPNMAQYGLTIESLRTMSELELFTWIWCLKNEMSLSILHDAENCHVIHYEAVCQNPVDQAKALFAFSGLNWSSQTEKFLHDSTEYKGKDRYYRVFRDANAAANKWRSELSDEEQRRILEIVAQTSLAPLWPETRQAATLVNVQDQTDQ
ncbi:MAG TPA: sulfotransferase [Acetobacteraceae bacterium]